MLKRVRDRLTILFFYTFSLAVPVLAADTPLAIIPAETSVIVRLKNPQGAIERLAKIADRLEPAIGPEEADGVAAPATWGAGVEEHALKASGELIRNPLFQGVDLEGEFWTLNTFAPDKSLGLVLVPTTDIAELQNSLPKDWALVPFDRWGVCTNDPQALEQIRDCIAGKGESIVGRLDPRSRMVFEQGNLGVLVNVRQLTTDYQADLTAAATAVAPADFESLFEVLFDSPTLSQTLAALSEQFMQGLLRTLPDTEIAAASLSLDADEARLESYLRVKPDSPTARWLQANPGSEMASLSTLPSSSALYFGFQGNIKAMAAWCAEFFFHGNVQVVMPWHEKVFNAFTLGPKALILENQIRDGYQALEFGSLVGALPMKPLEEGLLRVVTITEVDDPPRLRELNRQWSQIPDGLTGHDASFKVPLPDTEKYGSQTADVSVSPSPIASSIINELNVFRKGYAGKLLFGPDLFTTRMVYLDRRVVHMTGGSTLGMATVVRRATVANWSEQEPCFVNVRRKLGDKLNFIAMFDVGGILGAEMRALNATTDPILKVPVGNPAEGEAEAMLGLELPTSWIEEIEAAQSLTGFSVAFEPQGIQAKLIVPFEAAQAYIKFTTLMSPFADVQTKRRTKMRMSALKPESRGE